MAVTLFCVCLVCTCSQVSAFCLCTGWGRCHLYCVPCFLLDVYKHTHYYLSFLCCVSCQCLFIWYSYTLILCITLFSLISNLPSLSTLCITSFHFLFGLTFSLSALLHPFHSSSFLSSLLSFQLYSSQTSRCTQWKALQFFFTYRRTTVLLHHQSIGPYKEKIQSTQAATERCLVDDLL